MQRTSFAMEAGSLLIPLCALFMISAEGEPMFTKKPTKESVAVEGANVTLEWRYTVSGNESFIRAEFQKGRRPIVVKNDAVSAPRITIRSYRNRLHAIITSYHASITLFGVNRLDKGRYAFVVIYDPDYQTIDSTVEISALYLDKPSSTSTDTRPIEGTALTLSCNFGGEPIPTISWTINGSPLDISGNSRISAIDDNRHLTIRNVNRTDSGEYRCVAHNSLGNVSSNAIALSVRYKPTVALNPLNAKKAEGENVTWSCTATGNPEPNISWIFNGSHINMNYNPKIVFSNETRKMTITNVSRTDSGEYQCMANNNLGNASSQVATLDILFLDKPEISPLLRIIQRTDGDEATLFCIATGNPVPKISWTLNMVSLDTTNSSRMNLSYEGKQLIIRNVNRGDSGVYRCVAKNSLGNVSSYGTTLEVHYVPEVTMIGGPQQFAVVGKTKKFICEYDSVPPVFEVQWIKDGDVIAKNSSLLINESRLTVSHYNKSQTQLLIIQSTSKDAGNYTCFVINAIGNSSQKTSVISQELPLTTINPKEITVMEGEKLINLSCNATGNPEPSISWVKDGFSINNNTRISISKNNERLTITNVSRTDSGEYQCVAKNRVGNYTSNSKVDVYFEPEVSNNGNQKQYVAKGGDIRLICRYEASPPVSEVQWIKDGTVIARNASKLINGSRVTIPSFFNESQIQLSITAASLEDGGNYTCNATNILSSTQDTTMIVIEDKPEIATHPHNITRKEGQNATLYCNATGNPAPTISWTKDGNPLSNGLRIILSPSHERLKITNVNRIDGGEYRCEAKNRVGEDTSHASTVNVQYQAEIVSHPQAIITEEDGNNLTLFCNATGNPAAKISWTKDGSLIDNNSRINFSEDNKRLNIRNVNRNDKGSYRCVAKNSLGNDTSNVSTVDIQYRPEIASQPQIVAKPEEENVTLTCNATGNPEPELSWLKDKHLVRSSNRISLSAGNQSLMIANVSREDSGKYLCVAHNKIGNATSNITVLDVQYQPEIITNPSDDEVKEGKNTTLYCNATGNPLPTISWEKNGNPIGNNSRISSSAESKELKIINVYRTDRGTYRCVAVNSIGNATSRDATLDVEYQSEITAHPSNVTKTEGENVTLHCNATGNPLPTLSWTKDGSDLSNHSRISFSEGKNELTITSAKREDRGAYRCVANNSIGSNTSGAAIVNVQYQSKITTHPSNVTIIEGGNVTLHCNAIGNPLPTLSWTKDGSYISNNPRISFSEDREQLAITNTSRKDRGGYLCVAHNEVGNNTLKIAILDVQYRPEIVTQPQNVTKSEGKNVTLTCNATGNPEPELSWLKDEHLVRSSNRISLSAGNQYLMIGNVNRTDSGKYLCVALNNVGKATSKITILNVQYRSEITTHPSNVTKREGENITLHCNATGNPLPTLSWTKDGSDISNNSRISFSEDKNHLTITNAKRIDSGAFRCVANNSLGSNTSGAAIVNVQYQSEITTHPSNVTKREGENVTLHCNATGNPLPTLSWTKYGSDINNNSRISFSEDKNQLTITDAERIDSGAYRCVANNSLGKSTSGAAVVNVQFAPEISKHPRNITIVKGENVIFSCSVLGNPTPSVVWTKNGKDLNVTANSRLTVSSKNNNHSLEITEVDLSDSGQYLCVGNNSVYRSSSSAATLTVQDVPDPPTDVKVISRGSRLVNISWTAGFNGNTAIKNYTVEIREDEQIFRDALCQGTLLVNACVIYSTRVSIKELFPWTTYYLRVFARNKIGSGNYSFVVEVITYEEVPRIAPPFNVTVLDSTAVNVSWKMLTKQDARGEIQGYYILYKRKSDTQLPWRNRTVNKKETTSLVVTSLKKFTLYEFAIQAFNNKSVSVMSDVVERTTDQDVPSVAPKLNTAEPKNSTSIELIWEPVPERDLNGVLTGYVIRYWDDKEERYRDLEIPSSWSKVVINGLRASNTYSFYISAATIKGEGPQSEPKPATTKDPPIPPAPASDDIGTTEVSVAFKPRQILSNGTKVSYYQIIVVALRKGEGPGKSSDDKYVKVTRKYEDRMEGEPYITAEFSNNNELRTLKTFSVGNGKYYSRDSHIEARRKRRAKFTKYFNGELDDNTEYAVFQRSLSGPDDYENEGFTRFKTLEVIVSTAELEPEDKTVIVVVVFIVLFIVCVVVVGGIVIVWLRGRQRTNENEVDEDIPMEDRGYENFVPEGEIAVEDFEDHVKHLNDDDLFSVEYCAIHPRGNFTSKATLSAENKHKNRYNNIVAYDHSRVKLNPIKGVPGSDYINANFLNGYQKEKAYIATQGPLEHTTDDFWRMVWEQGTKTIVMVTNLEEKGRLKCHQYWPSEGAESYGDIKVTLVQTVELSEFTIRTMTLNHANNTEQRTVNQYHYTVWPDHGVPECPSSLLTFVRKASGANPPDAGPMVVHCSAGVGRTGTFIVVDAMLRRIAAEKTVDVYEYVTSLRQDRNLMVQVEEQYILIHDVLVEAIHSGFTEIHANDLRSHIKNLMQVNQTSGQSEMDEEFIRLGRCFSASQFTTQAANMACNVTKNRYPNAFPYDETRVKLSVISGVEGSDYINANFIDGYMARRAFIATQAPIPDTIPDFWRMIWEQESSTIVMLSKETEGGKVKVHHYWPAEKPTHIGTLVVEKTSEMTYEDYTMREMKLTHTKESASRVVRQYHYTGWPDSGSPESGTGLIDLIGQVQRWQQQSGNTKITVHCSAGVGRTGVFCALSILIGQLKSEGVVDVFQTVKQLRAQRPAMVQTKDQYEFIYSALSEYLDSFDAYSNF